MERCVGACSRERPRPHTCAGTRTPTPYSDPERAGPLGAQACGERQRVCCAAVAEDLPLASVEKQLWFRTWVSCDLG